MNIWEWRVGGRSVAHLHVVAERLKECARGALNGRAHLALEPRFWHGALCVESGLEVAQREQVGPAPAELGVATLHAGVGDVCKGVADALVGEVELVETYRGCLCGCGADKVPAAGARGALGARRQK